MLRFDTRDKKPKLWNLAGVTAATAVFFAVCLLTPVKEPPALAGAVLVLYFTTAFILLVSDLSKFRGNAEHYGAMDAGYASQNICLMCAALGLKTVPRAMMNYDEVKKALSLPENIALELNHPNGY